MTLVTYFNILPTLCIGSDGIISHKVSELPTLGPRSDYNTSLFMIRRQSSKQHFYGSGIYNRHYYENV
jgi:hypothetical protein